MDVKNGFIRQKKSFAGDILNGNNHTKANTHAGCSDHSAKRLALGWWAVSMVFIALKGMKLSPKLSPQLSPTRTSRYNTDKGGFKAWRMMCLPTPCRSCLAEATRQEKVKGKVRTPTFQWFALVLKLQPHEGFFRGLKSNIQNVSQNGNKGGYIFKSGYFCGYFSIIQNQSPLFMRLSSNNVNPTVPTNKINGLQI